MRTSTRRKLDGALLAGTGLLVGVAGGAGAVMGDEERVEQFWAQAIVQPDGSAEVTEVVDYNFGALAVVGDKHGIVRVVPGLPLDAPVVVESDAPHDLDVSEDLTNEFGGGTKLKIGDPGQTVSGEHRYRIGYPLPGVAVDQKVAWNAVGAFWDVDMERVEIDLLTPYELVDPACFVGPTGSLDPCSDVEQVAPGHLAVTVEDLSAEWGVSFEGTVGAPLASPPVASSPPAPPEDEGTPILPTAAVPAGAALVGAGITSRLVRRAGRERVGGGGAADAAWAGAVPTSERRVDHRELDAMATTEFAPPEDLRAPQGGLVLTEEVAPEHKVAWLIEAAIDGAVEMVEEDGKVVALRRLGGERSAETAAILDRAFKGRDEVLLGGYDQDFASAWSDVGVELEAWSKTSGLWDTRSDARRLAVRVGGAVVGALGVLAVLGGGVLAVQEGSAWLVLSAIGGVVTGMGVAAWVRAWEMRVRTPAGSAAWLRVESFRRFLAGSEAFHAEEAAKRGVLREYTAWAVAVGEIDRWSKAVRASTISPADAGMAYVFAAPALMSSTSSTATAPSSSGGGGGGGVGGGAGGGGGGSW